MSEGLLGAIQRIEFHPIPAVVALFGGGYVGYIGSDIVGPVMWLFALLWMFVMYAFWVIWSGRTFTKKTDAPGPDELEDY